MAGELNVLARELALNLGQQVVKAFVVAVERLLVDAGRLAQARDGELVVAALADKLLEVRSNRIEGLHDTQVGLLPAFWHLGHASAFLKATDYAKTWS